MTNFQLVPILIFLFASICAPITDSPGKPKLTPDVKEDINNAKVLLVRYEAPPLSFMTPKDAAGAGLIADLTQSDIAENRERHRFYPAALVQENLAALLQADGITTTLEIKEEAYPFAMPADLKDLSKYKGVEADYIVEVIVPLMGWRAAYGPTKWRTYSLNLGVEVRIIRTADLVRVWKTNVGHGGLQDKEMKFHITELEENGHGLIASKLDKLAMECSKKVVAKYIKAK